MPASLPGRRSDLTRACASPRSLWPRAGRPCDRCSRASTRPGAPKPRGGGGGADAVGEVGSPPHHAEHGGDHHHRQPRRRVDVQHRQGGEGTSTPMTTRSRRRCSWRPTSRKAPSGGPENAALTSTSPPARAGHSGSGDCSPRRRVRGRRCTRHPDAARTASTSDQSPSPRRYRCGRLRDTACGDAPCDSCASPRRRLTTTLRRRRRRRSHHASSSSSPIAFSHAIVAIIPTMQRPSCRSHHAVVSMP